MNIREAIETISNYLYVLRDEGVFHDHEIAEISDAENAIYEFLDAMGV